MSFFGKTKPTAPFSERRAAWAIRRGENHVPRRLGHYAALIAKEKQQQEAPTRNSNQPAESGLRLIILSL